MGLGYSGPTVNFPEDVHPEKPEGLAPWQAGEARRRERTAPSARFGDVLLRVALALPLVYLVDHVRGIFGFGPYFLFTGGDPWQFTVGLKLPAVGLSFGCVLVLSGWRARWPWLIVAASALWLPFGTNLVAMNRLAYPWPLGNPVFLPGATFAYWDTVFSFTALWVYALLLALAMLLGSGPLRRGGAAVAPRSPAPPSTSQQP